MRPSGASEFLKKWGLAPATTAKTSRFPVVGRCLYPFFHKLSPHAPRSLQRRGQTTTHRRQTTLHLSPPAARPYAPALPQTLAGTLHCAQSYRRRRMTRRYWRWRYSPPRLPAVPRMLENLPQMTPGIANRRRRGCHPGRDPIREWPQESRPTKRKEFAPTVSRPQARGWYHRGRAEVPRSPAAGRKKPAPHPELLRMSRLVGRWQSSSW